MTDSLEQVVEDIGDMSDAIPDFLPTELCVKCKGECCQILPGAFFPNDLGTITVESVVAFVLSGRACFDSWEGDPRADKDELPEVYFLRPRVVNASHKVVDRSWGGVCVHLSDTGCTLSRDDMPTACRTLEPGEVDCIDHTDGKHGAAMAWLPYHDILEKAASMCVAKTKLNRRDGDD